MDLELVRDEIVEPGVLQRLLDGSEPVPLPGSDGVVGRPSLAAPEKGKRIYEYLVAYIGDRLFPAAEEPSV